MSMTVAVGCVSGDDEGLDVVAAGIGLDLCEDRRVRAQ